MVSRALIASLLLVPLLTSLVSAQVSQLISSSNAVVGTLAVLAGRVWNADGKPAAGVHIELDAANTALPVTSSATDSDGTFELYNIPQGDYEVIADSGSAQASDAVTVQSSVVAVELRFSGVKPVLGNDATVSVAHLLVPEKAWKMYRRALEAYKSGHDDDAQHWLEQALLIEPEFAEALTLQGFMEMQRNELEAAQKCLEHAIRIDASAAGAYVALGAVYNHEGRFDDALKASERGTSLSPRSWEGYFEMAKASVGKGMYQKALLLARQAERLGGSGFAGLHLIKAYALYPLKLYKDARYELQAALSREPKGSSSEQAKTLLARINSDTAAASIVSVH